MTGGFIAGGLGVALAALAEVLVLTAPSRPGLVAANTRYLAAAFVGGEAVLCIVVIILTATLGGTVDTAIGFLTAAMVGAGSFGIALTFRGFMGRPGEATLQERAGLLVRLAIFQAIGVVGIMITLLTLFLLPS